MRENEIQNALYHVIDKALEGLKTLGYISLETREKINNILYSEIKWDSPGNREWIRTEAKE